MNIKISKLRKFKYISLEKRTLYKQLNEYLKLGDPNLEHTVISGNAIPWYAGQGMDFSKDYSDHYVNRVLPDRNYPSNW